MWARAAGSSKVAPTILTLALLSFIIGRGELACAQIPIAGLNPALNPRQNFNQIRQSIIQLQQAHTLERQIGELQLQSTNWTLQIEDLKKELQAEMPAGQQAAPEAANPDPAAAPADPAEPKPADAKSQCESLKQKLLAALHETAEYRRAQATLEAARANLANANADDDVPRERLIAISNKIIACDALIARLERQALNDSAEWKAANAKLHEANKPEVAVRIKPDQAVAETPAAPAGQPLTNVQQLQAKIREVTAMRDQVDAQARPLMQQSVPPAAAKRQRSSPSRERGIQARK